MQEQVGGDLDRPGPAVLQALVAPGLNGSPLVLFLGVIFPLVNSCNHKLKLVCINSFFHFCSLGLFVEPLPETEESKIPGSDDGPHQIIMEGPIQP